VAESLHLGDHLRLGRGEERSGGRRKTVLLANCFEAIVAALYLDGGLEGTRTFVERTVIDSTAQRLYQGLGRGESMGDHKSALQEMLQAKGAAPPEYEVKAETGPDHRKRFLVEVVIPGSSEVRPVTAQGTGTTKKRAEQEAARVAFQQLHEQDTAATAHSAEAPAVHERSSSQPEQQQASPSPSKGVIA
jgi:ribonuclease III